MDFSGTNTGVGYHLQDLPDPGIEPRSLVSDALAGRFFTTSATWEDKKIRPWSSDKRRQLHPTPVLLPENPMDGGARWATAHGVAQLDTTERLHFHFQYKIKSLKKTKCFNGLNWMGIFGPFSIATK